MGKQTGKQRGKQRRNKGKTKGLCHRLSGGRTEGVYKGDNKGANNVDDNNVVRAAGAFFFIQKTNKKDILFKIKKNYKTKTNNKKIQKKQ